MAADSPRRVLLVGPDQGTRGALAELFDADACCDGIDDADAAAKSIAVSDYALVVMDATEPMSADPVIAAVAAIDPERRPVLFILFDEAGNLPRRLDPRVVTVLLPRPRGEGVVRDVLKQTLRRVLAVAGDATLRRLRDAGAVTPEAAEAKAKDERRGQAKNGRQSHPKNVLVVDDDHALRDLIAAILRREKLQADTAPDGEQAIDKLAAQRYAVLILDLMMPKLSGWEVIGWLRANPERRPRTVIVNTAADRSILTELDPDVVNAIFVKPFDVTELGAYVRACATLDLRKDRRRRRVIRASG